VSPSPWSFGPAWVELAAIACLGAVYALAYRRHPAPPARFGAFAAALALLVLVFVSPLDTLSLHYLLSAHLLQNVVLAEWAPALAVAGLGAGMAEALARRRPVAALTRPLVALPLWLVTYGAWHVPPVYDAALRNHALLHLEHASYFLAGVFLWWPVFHDAPRRLSSGAKSAYLFAAFLLASPLGLLLAFLPDPVYAFYAEAPRIWGLSAATDQQIAGVVMTASEALVFLGLSSYFLARFLAEEVAGYSHPHA